MFSYKKTAKEFPELQNKTTYDTESIYNQLISDSFNKCYLCGEYQGNSRSERVEHFIPHENGKHKDLKYDWNNLFFSCDHCNNRKSSTYNKIGENKDILNPIKDEIEQELIQFYDSNDLNDLKIGIDIIGQNPKNSNTKELLEKIYNGDLDNKSSFAVRNKSKTLKKNILAEVFDFEKMIHNLSLCSEGSYEETKMIEEIKEKLSLKSNFYEFKKGLIKKDLKIQNFLMQRNVI